MVFVLICCVFGALGFGIGFTLGTWRSLTRRKPTRGKPET